MHRAIHSALVHSGGILSADLSIGYIDAGSFPVLSWEVNAYVVDAVCCWWLMIESDVLLWLLEEALLVAPLLLQS
jgi:hypothetical protein